MYSTLKCPKLSITDSNPVYHTKMKGMHYGMLNYQPEDQSEPTQHQVVTATGEAPLLYGNKHKPIVVDDDEDEKVGDVHFSEDHSFPAKKVRCQPAKTATDSIKPAKRATDSIKPAKTATDIIKPAKTTTNIIKPAKFKPKEIDVGSGTRWESIPVSLKGNKNRRKTEDVEVIEVDDVNTPDKLNIQLRPDPWLDAIIRNGKKGLDDYLFPENLHYLGLEEDNFQDFSHLDSRVYDEFCKGFVVLGTKKAVSSLLTSDFSLKVGTHGVIVDQSIPPSYDGLFEEGKGLQYKVLRELGKGSFGTVSYCRHYLGQEYVKKVINDKFNRKEVEVLMQLSHPNITSFRGYIYREGAHEILMEYGGDSLKTLMEKNKLNFQEVFTCDVVKELSLQGFSALNYMYDLFGILHLDVKPENLCVHLNPPTLKLTDFGTSKTPEQGINFNGWTPEYMSPEASRLLIAPLLQNPPAGFTEELTGKADVFAFGLVICFMLTGSHSVCTLWPKSFTNETFMEWRRNYINHLALNPDFMLQIAIKDEWPKELRDLLCSVLAGSTRERITAKQACQSIQQLMESEQVYFPTVFSQGLPSSPASSDLPTSESMYDAPGSPGDVSLSHPPGGGKDIKNQLRRKIRRKSAAPYERQIISVAAVKEKACPAVGGLPDFAGLGMED